MFTVIAKNSVCNSVLKKFQKIVFIIMAKSNICNDGQINVFIMVAKNGIYSVCYSGKDLLVLWSKWTVLSFSFLSMGEDSWRYLHAVRVIVSNPHHINVIQRYHCKFMFSPSCLSLSPGNERCGGKENSCKKEEKRAW